MQFLCKIIVNRDDSLLELIIGGFFSHYFPVEECAEKRPSNMPHAGGRTHFLDCKSYFSPHTIYCTSDLHNWEQMQPEAAPCPSRSREEV